MATIKFIAWLLYDVNMLGVFIYTFLTTLEDNVNIIEKALLGLLSMIFFVFRIRSLHLDNQKKEIDNEERRQQISQKKIELEERTKRLNNFKK